MNAIESFLFENKNKVYLVHDIVQNNDSIILTVCPIDDPNSHKQFIFSAFKLIYKQIINEKGIIYPQDIIGFISQKNMNKFKFTATFTIR